MRVAVITVAGISSRFNKDIEEEKKVLKCLYTEGDLTETLLYHMVSKLSYADKIIIVGGYKFDDLSNYVKLIFDEITRSKLELVKNNHFEDLASGYSLYLGLKRAFESADNIEELLFVEGDLDIDRESIEQVIDSSYSVLTYNNELIYANKAVVLYQDATDHFKYAFNSFHGMLTINEPFKCILNSGQLWKFTDIDTLKSANDTFGEKYKDGTNLKIIQDYIDGTSSEIRLIGLNRWTNCNTRDDFRNIKKAWEAEE